MNEPERNRCPYVVGLGASAGGLEPLEQFFDAMPTDSGVAFVVIQHLSPDFKSLMKELLTRHTPMSVHRVEDDMLVEPDSIYLIPPQKDMRLEEGRLRLYDQNPDRTRSPNFAIDMFFESLAKDMGNRAIAVILSGTGSDGSRGIRTVNENGGLVVVQQPETSQFDGMPRSAIATGSVHSVLPPDEIARSIYDYIKRLDASSPEGPMLPGVTDRAVIQEVVALLRMDNGVDFSHYRPGTIARRVSRRISTTEHESVATYIAHLSKSADERRALRNDLLIGVTNFFRDPPAWQVMTEQVLRPLIEQKKSNEPIRVWVTACSTGEEVYSLGICILEEMARQKKHHDVKIFATDIDKRSLEQAALGLFPIGVAEDIGRDRLTKYFVQEGGGFRVTRRVREMVIFAEHNLTRDAAFTNMDLVTCRNVLIYMEPMLQQRVLSMLHFALRVGGTLFMGAAETLGDLEREFSITDNKWKIFCKRRDVTLNRDQIRRGMALVSPVVARRRPQHLHTSPPASVSTSGDAHTRVLKTGFRLMLHDKQAAAVLVDDTNALLHAFGRVSEFIKVPEGAGTRDLLRMLDNGLALPVGAGLHRVRTQDEPVSYTDIPLESEPGKSFDIVIARVNGSDDEPFSALVLFELAQSGGTQRTASPFTIDDHIATRIHDLEHELQQSRENLQATIEELGTTNEEHQATNEELLASNEELQSTNEELQSVNEELYTVNAEHQTKIQELTDLNQDMDNLLRSTQNATLFLDERMRIRKYTPAVLGIVQLTDQDVGRDISDFRHRTDAPRLWDQIRQVADTGTEFEARLRTDSGSDYYLRAVPYEIEPGEYAGVVATFFDIEYLERALNAPSARALDPTSS